MLESRTGAPPTSRTPFVGGHAHDEPVRHQGGIHRRSCQGTRDRRTRATPATRSTIALGGHCWLSSAHWTMTLGDAPTLDLYSDFLVRRAEGELSIAAYLTRQDLSWLVRDMSGADRNLRETTGTSIRHAGT
ncbi:hypothetical protein [Nocardia sp. NPDC004750]